MLARLCSRLSDQLVHLTMCKCSTSEGTLAWCDHPGHLNGGGVWEAMGRDSESPERLLMAQRSSIGSTAPSSAGADNWWGSLSTLYVSGVSPSISPMYVGVMASNRASSPITKASIVSSSSASSSRCSLSACSGIGGKVNQQQQQQYMVCSPGAVVNVGSP